MQIGTDILSIKRIEQALVRTPHFAERILSPDEYALYQGYPPARAIAFLAGRFCAKEAYGKALGTGVMYHELVNITILPDELGRPTIVQGPRIEGVSLSISHCRDYATATVLIE